MSSKRPLGHKSVLTAMLGNATVMAIKFAGFFASGSAVMLSEAIHSVADTANQALLFVGIKRSQKPADEDFNYGYLQERFFWSLLSACGIFFLGAGFTLYHGLESLLHPAPAHLNGWLIPILLVSFLFESLALATAIRELRKAAKDESLIKFTKHSGDPTLLAVVYEDSAAILGIFIALASIVLTKMTGLYFWDAIGSIFIGLLLAIIASLLIKQNRDLLIGRAVPRHIRKKIFAILLHQKIVDEVHDFKTVMIATDGYRIKAEIEVNGHYLADKIFESRDFREEYEEIENYDDFVRFCTLFADEVTRTLGREIDSLEDTIEKEVPLVKHIDIEAN